MLTALTVLTLLAVAGLFGTVLVAGVMLSRPVRFAAGPPPPALGHVETVQIRSSSGSVLSGWWIDGRPGGGCLILMHGVRRSRRTMVRRAEILQQLGFAVLLFDFQAHGESTGPAITFGRREALDAAAALAFARHRLPDERVGIIGVSLGGAAALLPPGPLAVDAMVLESVFPDVCAVLANRLRLHCGPIKGTLLLPVVSPMCRVLLRIVLGVRSRTLRPIEQIGRVTAPVLVASGTRDRSTTIAEARALFARATEPKQFWAVEGARHVNLERYNPDAYWQVVLPFLTRYVRSAAAANDDAVSTPAAGLPQSDAAAGSSRRPSWPAGT